MRIVLVEDNPAVRDTLITYLQELFSGLVLVGSASSVEEGVEIIQREKPDLVFLDVEMPDGDGFELLRRLQPVHFQVIFTTAHEKYALKAIKFSALDFLLKPIDEDDLIAAVEKAKKEIENASTHKRIEALLQNVDRAAERLENIVVSDKYGIQVIKVKNIIRMEGEGNYTKIFLVDQSSMLVTKGLKEFDEQLIGDGFFRCHQSHLINLDFLARYDKREGDVLLLLDDSSVPLAKRKKEALLKILKV